MLTAVYQGVLAAGTAGLLYSGTITVTALTAIYAPTAARRRAARDALILLLRRRVS